MGKETQQTGSADAAPAAGLDFFSEDSLEAPDKGNGVMLEFPGEGPDAADLLTGDNFLDDRAGVPATIDAGDDAGDEKDKGDGKDQEAADKQKAAEEGKKDEGSDAWDKQRQKIQQDYANYRKSSEAQIEAQNAQIQELREMIEQVASGKPAGGKGDEDAELVEIDDSSDAEQIAKAIKQRDGLIRNLSKKLDDLGKGLQQRELAENARAQQQADAAELNDFLGRMDAKHGAKHRQDAIKAAREHFLEVGYSRDNPPSPEQAKSEIARQYERLAQTEGAAAAAKEKPGQGPVDTGAGGAHADSTVTGTLNDVVAAMQKEGKLPRS